MQGADRVNDELEVGFDETFETRWSRIERVGHVVLSLLVAAGPSGLLGHGRLSHRTTRSVASGLAIDYEPIARSQTDTQVTFRLDNPTDAGTMDLFVGSRVIEPMGLHQILPEPVRTQAVADGMMLTVAVPPHSRGARLRVMLMPSTLGPEHLLARLDGRPPLGWSQFVMP